MVLVCGRLTCDFFFILKMCACSAFGPLATTASNFVSALHVTNATSFIECTNLIFDKKKNYVYQKLLVILREACERN